MPDHRFMYPKVVPVAVKEPVPGTGLHNFAAANVRNSFQSSGLAVPQPKPGASL
jgi:hypothetical protein